MCSLQDDCSIEIAGLMMRTIAGYGRMTVKMMNVLLILRESDDDGYPFCGLDDVHWRTINTLSKRDFLMRSPGLDGVKYKLTNRGKLALKMYETPVQVYRKDGICPVCGINPKHVYDSGRVYGYCLPCARTARRRNHQLNGYRVSRVFNEVCPRCQKRKRHLTESGRIKSWCLHCRRKDTKNKRPGRTAARLAAIAAGDVARCCKCADGVHYTERSVYDYCRRHLREYMNEYNRRRRQGKGDL